MVAIQRQQKVTNFYMQNVFNTHVNVGPPALAPARSLACSFASRHFSESEYTNAWEKHIQRSSDD